MGGRITRGVTRSLPITIHVNDAPVAAYAGETLLTALLASDTLVLSRDLSGRPRSPFCNMGTCFDCVVSIAEPGAAGADACRRARACLTPVVAGMQIFVPVK